MARVIRCRRDWTVGKQLGEGGFGKVYLATAADGEQAAIKLIKKLPGADRELLVARDVTGLPHVMAIIDDSETRTDYAIVMPLANRPLQDVMDDRGGPIPVEEALPILTALAEGVAATHAAGIVTRDVKPSNVLEWNGSWHVSDFGIARYVASSTALFTFKDVGTEAYTAPERWRGERAEPPADVYSLGVTMHAVLAGELPFKGPDFGRQHQRDSPQLIPNVPPRLASLVLEALDKSAVVRPTAANVAKRLGDLTIPSTPGGAALQAANAVIAARSAAESADRASAQSDAERRAEAFESAQRRFRVVEEMLRDQLAEASQVADATVRTSTNGWARSLGDAVLSVDPVQPVHARAWGSWRPAFDVFANTWIAIRIPTDRYGWSGRSHSLWFGDATEAGVIRWHETAFMNNPLVPSMPPVEPFALPPNAQSGEALAPIVGSVQIAWPFLTLDQGDEQQFIDRWLGWLAAAAQGQLRRSSSMPERNDAHNSWRR